MSVPDRLPDRPVTAPHDAVLPSGGLGDLGDLVFTVRVGYSRNPIAWCMRIGRLVLGSLAIAIPFGFILGLVWSTVAAGVGVQIGHGPSVVEVCCALVFLACLVEGGPRLLRVDRGVIQFLDEGMRIDWRPVAGSSLNLSLPYQQLRHFGMRVGGQHLRVRFPGQDPHGLQICARIDIPVQRRTAEDVFDVIVNLLEEMDPPGRLSIEDGGRVRHLVPWTFIERFGGRPTTDSARVRTAWGWRDMDHMDIDLGGEPLSVLPGLRLVCVTASGEPLLELIGDSVVDPEGVVVFHAVRRSGALFIECGDETGTYTGMEFVFDAELGVVRNPPIDWEGSPLGTAIIRSASFQVDLVRPMPDLWVLGLVLAIGPWRDEQ